MNLIKCPDCDRPTLPYTNCPWCNAFVMPAKRTNLLFFALGGLSLIFFVASCLVYLPPAKTGVCSIVFGLILGAVAAWFVSFKHKIQCVMPIAIAYALFLSESISRAVCIHAPFILFLFLWAFFFNTLKANIMPSGNLIKRMLSSTFLWLPLLIASCFYSKASGALLIPAIVLFFAMLQLYFIECKSIVSFVAIFVVTCFALLYFNFWWYLLGFIIALIVRAVMRKCGKV